MKYDYCISFKGAIALAVAFLVLCSCSQKLKKAEVLDLNEIPSQVITDMFAVQTKNGMVLQRMEAPVMEKYEKDTASWECFPNGLSAYMYTEGGKLETIVRANYAKHSLSSKRKNRDIWEAYGNVIIHNVIKMQTLETDTLYWNRKESKIFTDAYVKMYSPDGFMQGIGMSSDDRARNSILLQPYDSYGYTQNAESGKPVDIANFIGPLQ